MCDFFMCLLVLVFMTACMCDFFFNLDHRIEILLNVLY